MHPVRVAAGLAVQNGAAVAYAAGFGGENVGLNTLLTHEVSHLIGDILAPLYALCKQYIPGGIASYIKTKRLLKAKELLLTTDISASDISLKVGFSDYNYLMCLNNHKKKEKIYA